MSGNLLILIETAPITDVHAVRALGKVALDQTWVLLMPINLKMYILGQYLLQLFEQLMARFVAFIGPFTVAFARDGGQAPEGRYAGLIYHSNWHAQRLTVCMLKG